MPVPPLAVAAALSTCKVEHARYTLRTAPSVTAGFVAVKSGPDWPSRVAYWIDLGRTGRKIWYVPWEGGTDGRHNLASTTPVDAPGWTPPSPDGGPRPMGNTQYIGTNAAYGVIDHMPNRGEPAPAHILLPELDDALRHPADWKARRESVPTQFFDLTGCDPTG